MTAETTEHGKNTSRVLQVIRDAGQFGIIKSQLTIRTPRIDAEERDEIIAALLTSGDISQEEERRYGCRPATRFYALTY